MRSGRFGLVFAGVILLPLTVGFRACAQSEIDPDHFDSPNTEPFPQPKAFTNTRIGPIQYDGEFTLPHGVRCNGKSLRPGKYTVSFRGNDKAGQATLIQKGHLVEIAGTIQPQAAKQRDEVVVINNGKGRALSIIRVNGFDYVFDPAQGADPSPNSKPERTEKFTLTVIVPKGLAKQGPTQTSPNP